MKGRILLATEAMIVVQMCEEQKEERRGFRRAKSYWSV
jgi:hypothetical protein